MFTTSGDTQTSRVQQMGYTSGSMYVVPKTDGKLRQEKCEFHLSELRYLDHGIDATGIGIWSQEIPQVFVWSSVHNSDRSQTITFNTERQGSSAIHSSSTNAKGALLSAYIPV